MKKLLLFTLLSLSSIPFLVAQLSRCNCWTETHSQFDFWIASWETYNPDAALAGTNEIDKTQDQCILRENWTSAKQGYTETSYNLNNYQKKKGNNSGLITKDKIYNYKPTELVIKWFLKSGKMKD